MMNVLIFTLVLAIGEIFFNLTWFKYLKNVFEPMNPDAIEANKTAELENTDITFFRLPLSTFKGVMERFILTLGLVLSFASILIVFGTVKLGTRFNDNHKVKNDYFLIGNFSSILIALLYYIAYIEFIELL
jgi:hypothetical protein